MTRTVTLGLCLLVVAACGSKGEGSVQSVKTRQTTTTVETPEDRFLERIKVQLDYEDPSTPQMALDMALSMCSALDAAAEGPADDDAANDTPESDASVSDQMVTLGLDTVMNTELDDAVTATIMRTGADFLCPSHAVAVVNYLAGKGF